MDSLSVESEFVKRVLMIFGLLLIIATSGTFIVVQLFKMNGVPHQEARDDDSVKPPIKAIMINGFRDEPSSVLGRIGRELEEKEIPWDNVQHDSDEFLELTKKLETLSPRRGESNSWKRLTSQLVQSATDLATASQRKDLEASKVQREHVFAACTECHKAHR
jgi:hypothetical protein